jgi:uncharacterized protein
MPSSQASRSGLGLFEAIVHLKLMIVGHSSGAILSLILAQSLPVFGRVIGVSVFHDNSLDWDANSKLFDVEFDWIKLKTSSGKLLFIHSDNDPYVPLDQAQYVANKCGVELKVIPNQGHFNLEHSEKYKQFPELMETINQNR